MATCPKCGHKLTLFDWKPNCPECGINLVYYGMDEKLMNEADAAEVEHAHLQKKIDRLKASFVGSPLAIVRIFLSLLPIGALMLPVCSLSFSGPLIEQTTKSINAIEIYNYVSSLDFGALFTMMGSKLVGGAFTSFFISIAAILLSVVFVIVSLVALVAACGPHGKQRNYILNSLSIIFAAAAAMFFSRFASQINGVFPEFVSGKLEIGVIVYLAALFILLGINILIGAKGNNVKYKECFVGGIPAEEYEKLVADGVDIEEIHQRMIEILDKKAAERAEAERKKYEAKKKAEDEELAKKAGKA